jgi:electron transport complex protein RnfC
MKLKTFPKGGIHVHGRKSTAAKPVQILAKPKKVVIPLSQHTGQPAKLLVNKGDLVSEGQLIAAQDGVISAAVHASMAGKVKDIIECATSGLPRTHAVVIEPAPEADALPVSGRPTRDPALMKPDEILQAIREAGIVGMGGAAFPTSVKLDPPNGRKITDLIINAVECEPYLTSDHRIMLENADEIVSGIAILRRLLAPARTFIGIENNKKDAIALLSAKTKGTGIEVVALKEKYPQGGEKQLIMALTGRIVPSGKLPLEVGCGVQNVGTVLAIKRAVCDGIPLTDRVITVTGSIVKNPGNYRVRVGTLLCELLEQIGGLSEDPGKIIFGGPMTGPAVAHTNIPIVKGTSGVLFLSRKEAGLADYSHYQACIRCGRCVIVCPMGLNPSLLSQSGELERWEEMKSTAVFDCMECGSCNYICPSKRPIVQLVKTSKSALRKIV